MLQLISNIGEPCTNITDQNQHYTIDINKKLEFGCRSKQIIIIYILNK